jgi:hypothetical protein
MMEMPKQNKRYNRESFIIVKFGYKNPAESQTDVMIG